MMETKLAAPFPNSYWVSPNQLLAGEYPGDADENAATKRLTALLDAGIRTFIDLTDEDEINEDAKPVPRYRSLLRNLTDERRRSSFPVLTSAHCVDLLQTAHVCEAHHRFSGRGENGHSAARDAFARDYLTLPFARALAAAF